jgi:hypothetical protein
MLYEIRCLHEIETPKGEMKKVLEQFLFDAELVSECEAKMLEEIPEGEVTSVCRSKIIEIVNENVRGGNYYKGKITETSVNDDGSESSRSYIVLCNAESVPEATKIFQEYIKAGLESMVLDSVTKTKIVDILV